MIVACLDCQDSRCGLIFTGMKLFVMSDIHGSPGALSRALEAYSREACDRLVLLGDLLNHGPRNPLPADYNPPAVVELLEPYASRIIAVRGNCDSEVDQMLFSFPMMGDYAQVLLDGRSLFLTHGHRWTVESAPLLPEGSLFVSGHTHIPVLERHAYLYAMNPGSVSIPKGESKAGYGIIEPDYAVIKQLDGTVVAELELA